MTGISKRKRIQKRFNLFNEIQPLEARAYLSAVSFAAPVTSSTTLAEASLMADFNGDQKADLVSVDPAGNIDVSLSNGDGTFASPVVIPVVGTPTALATGHFDTSGNLDIVAGTTGSPGSISIIAGNGDGSFLAANDIAALDNNSSIAVGDFNNDGDEDILTVSDSALPSGNAMLLTGNGTAAAFSQAPFSLPFGSVSAVVAGDFNGDGNLDFAVANQLNASVSVFMGNGNGTFQAPVTYSAGSAAGDEPTSMVVSDITGKTLPNGKPELDIITGNENGTVSYLANEGDGTFASAVTSNGGGAGITAISIANFNNDGRADLLAVDSSISALVLLGNGNGTFTAAGKVEIGTAGASAAVGDINGDGLSDVVGISGGELSASLDAYSVGATSSTISLTAASMSVDAGNSDQLTATIVPTAATGSVNFMANGVSIGTADVTNGNAVLTATLNTAGDTDITAIYSGDATYSTSTSTAITVTVAGTPVEAQPLVPVVTHSTLPAALVGGIAAHGTATVQVTNSTSDTIKGLIIVNVYASTNGVVDAKSILVGTAKEKMSVKPDRSFTVSVSMKILATTLSVGSYRLLAQTLDPSNNPSVSTTGPNLSVATPFVMLAESFTRLELASDLVGGSKSSVVALIKITNTGNIISSGVTPLDLYVSPDGTPGSGVSLNEIRKHLVIGVDKSIVLAVPLKAIPNATAGVYSVGVQVTDPMAGTSSAVYPKIVNIGTPTVDLANAITATPTTAALGKKISVTLEVTNDGNIFAKGMLQIAFASSATSDGSNPTPLSTQSVQINLKPSGILRLHLKVLIPLNASTGSNYLVATLDPNNVFSDPNLLNNTAVSLVPIVFG